MVQITFEIRGKRVDPDDIADGLERSVLKLLEAFINEDIGLVRCPIHGTQPKVICSGENLNNLTVEIFGCCDELSHAGKTAIIANSGGDYSEKIHNEVYGEEAHKLKGRFPCRVCKRHTTHILQYAQTTNLFGEAFLRENNPYLFIWDVWLVWKCRNCNELLLEIGIRSPAWFQGNSWEDLDLDFEESSTFFPSFERAKQTISGSTEPNLVNSKSFSHVPRKIQRVYSEVTQAYNYRVEILCTIGIRSLVEELTKDKRVPKEKELWKRIQNLASLGIPIGTTENLQGVKELGNKAAHELKPAKREDLRIAIELIEDILHFVYELEPKTKRLKRHRKKQTPKDVTPPK